VLAGEYPGIPYNEYSWMAGFYERLFQPAWADRAYEEALKQRKALPQPIAFSNLIDRIINTQFMRYAAWASQKSVDLERQHLWLERVRESRWYNNTYRVTFIQTNTPRVPLYGSYITCSYRENRLHHLSSTLHPALSLPAHSQA